jgi:predicted FMN-binding regulatory protein PaiB
MTPARDRTACSAPMWRANPLWQRCTDGTPVMVVFRGAEAYISPGWYPSKHEMSQNREACDRLVLRHG